MAWAFRSGSVASSAAAERSSSNAAPRLGGCYCDQRLGGRSVPHAAARPYGTAPSGDSGCTWPQCIVPVLNAKLGSSGGGSSGGGSFSGGAGSGLAGGTSSSSGGPARGIVPGAVAAASGIRAPIGAGVSLPWPSQQQQQQQRQQHPKLPQQQQQQQLSEQQQQQQPLIDVPRNGKGGSPVQQAGPTSLAAVADSAEASPSTSPKTDGLLVEIAATTSFFELRSIWRRSVRPNRRARSGNSGSRSRGRMQGHYLAAVLRQLALTAAARPQQPSKGEPPSQAASDAAPLSDPADVEDWESSWQDANIGSWDGGEGFSRNAGASPRRGSPRSSPPGSPRSGGVRPQGSADFVAEQPGTSGRAAAASSWPLRPARYGGPSSPGGASLNRPAASSGLPALRDAPRRPPLWPLSTSSSEQQQGEAYDGLVADADLEREWRQQQERQQESYPREQAQSIAVPPPPAAAALRPSQQQQPQQQQQQLQQQQAEAEQDQQRRQPFPSGPGLRRPPARTAAAIANASRDGASPSSSFASLDGAAASSSAPVPPAIAGDGPAPRSLQQGDQDGSLITNAAMAARADRAGSGMTRGYASRAAAAVARTRFGGGSDITVAARAPPAPGPADVEALLSEIQAALRAAAPQLSPAAAASALRSLAQLRRAEPATVTALLSAPLAPRRLMQQRQCSRANKDAGSSSDSSSSDGSSSVDNGKGPVALLGSVAASLALLGHPPPAGWLVDVGDRLIGRPADVVAAAATEPDAAARLLFHLARAGWRPGPDEAAVMAAALQPHFDQLAPTELAQALQALVLLGAPVDEGWLADYYTASRRVLRDTPAHRSVHALSALAVAGRRPDEAWLRALFSSLVPSALRSLPPAEWPRLLSSLATLGARPDGAWLRSAYAICAAHALRRLPPRGLADLAGGAAALGMSPPAAWVAELAAAAFWALPYAGPAELADLGAALAALRATPGDVWLRQYEARATAVLAAAEGPELARLLSSLVALRHRPSPIFLSAWEAASHSRLGAFGAEGLASAARAMAEAGAAPSLSWVYALVAASYGNLEAFDAVQLGALFDALPRLAPQPRWADDLVQICSIEAARRRGTTTVSQRPAAPARSAASAD